MPKAYEGNSPYIFVSYSHKDNKTVHSMIEYLQSQGFRVWFDGGIEAGSEWPEYIANHLQDSSCVLAFISDTFVESHNCKRELNFAQELNKPLLSVYIEDVELTAGMRMQLGLSQALFRKNYTDEQSFWDALVQAKILAPCREEVTQPVQQKTVPMERRESQNETPRSPVETKTKAESDPKEKKSMPKAAKRLGWLIALLELSYALIGGYALGHFTQTSANGFALFALMLIPHTVIAVANMIVLILIGKRMGWTHVTDLCVMSMLMAALSSVLGIVVGTFYVHFQIVGILKFLISLGLNVVPTAIAILTYFGIMCATPSEK